MVVVMKAGSILIQLMNFFFLASGLVNDLLIIRLCLTFAYTFLLLSGLLGLPSWGEALGGTGRIAPDTIVWAIVNIVVVHGSGVIRMYYDERSIDFRTEEQAMLWRFFYRHSGLSKAQFLDLIVPHLTVTIYKAGDSISYTSDFNIVLDGSVLCKVVHEDYSNNDAENVLLASGDMFPLIHIYKHFMPQKSFFHRSAIRNPVVESNTAKVASIPAKKLEEMAVQPNAKVAWTAMLIGTLSEIAEREFRAHQSKSNVSVSRHAGRTHPMFGSLLPHEEPDPLQAGSGRGLSHPIRHALRYVWSSMYLPWPFGNWPVGLRHYLPAPRGDHEPTEFDPSKHRASLATLATADNVDPNNNRTSLTLVGLEEA